MNRSPDMRARFTNELDMSLAQQQGVGAMVVAMVGHFADRLGHEICNDYPIAEKSVAAKTELSALFARHTINRIGVELFNNVSELYKGEGKISDIESRIEEGVENEVASWRTDRNKFHNILMFPPVSVGDELQSEWEKKMTVLDEAWWQKYPSPTRKLFAKVRTAQYTVIEPQHAEMIADLHDKKLLDKKTLELIKDGQPPDILAHNKNTFVQEVRRGVFDKPLDPKKLKQDLANTNPRGIQTVGRMLIDENRKCLIWILSRQSPPDPDESVREIIQRYINSGETGNMHYLQLPGMVGNMKQFLLNNWQQIQLFGHVQRVQAEAELQGLEKKPSDVHFAPNRISALLFAEMAALNQAVKYILIDRMNGFTLHPNLDALKDLSLYRTLPQHNTSSQRFSFSRGFQDIAIDFNKKSEEPFILRGIDGQDRILNCGWSVSRGDVEEVVEKSRKIWQNDRISHADFSADDKEHTPVSWLS